jgi:hypothetical protein
VGYVRNKDEYGKMPFHIVYTIAWWVSMLKEGNTYVKDNPHPGRPITATSEKDISTVKAKVDIPWRR